MFKANLRIFVSLLPLVNKNLTVILCFCNLLLHFHNVFSLILVIGCKNKVNVIYVCSWPGMPPVPISGRIENDLRGLLSRFFFWWNLMHSVSFLFYKCSLKISVTLTFQTLHGAVYNKIVKNDMAPICFNRQIQLKLESTFSLVNKRLRLYEANIKPILH